MPVISSSTRSRVPTQLLHRDVKDRLQARMAEEWPAGSRLPSIAELALQFGVGLQTAHKAVRELVDEGVLVSRPRHGTFVAQADVTSSDKKLPGQGGVLSGVVVGSDTRPRSVKGKRVCLCFRHTANGRTKDGMLDKMIHALSQEIESAGGVVSINNLLDDNQWVDEAKDDAVVLINPYSTGRIVTRPNLPLLVISTSMSVPVGVTADYDVVTVDHEQGSMIVGHKLRGAGCKSVGYIGKHLQGQSNRYVETSALRLRALEAGWGAPVLQEHQLHVNLYTIEDGAQASAQYAQMKNRPEAIFAASDDLAVGFVLGLIPFGLKAGRDYSIAGFDGQQIGKELSQGALSTVEVPATLMGKRGGELLIDRLGHPSQPVRRLSLGCSWFEGATIVHKHKHQD